MYSIYTNWRNQVKPQFQFAQETGKEWQRAGIVEEPPFMQIRGYSRLGRDEGEKKE